MIEGILHVVETLDGFCLQIYMEDKTANEASYHDWSTHCPYCPIKFSKCAE